MSNSELHRLLDENETLRDRLKTVVQSPLSDSEKQQIIRDSQRLHSSAPASIALPNVSCLLNASVFQLDLIFAHFRAFTEHGYGGYSMCHT